MTSPLDREAQKDEALHRLATNLTPATAPLTTRQAYATEQQSEIEPRTLGPNGLPRGRFGDPGSPVPGAPDLGSDADTGAQAGTHSPFDRRVIRGRTERRPGDGRSTDPEVPSREGPGSRSRVQGDAAPGERGVRQTLAVPHHAQRGRRKRRDNRQRAVGLGPDLAIQRRYGGAGSRWPAQRGGRQKTDGEANP